MRIIRARLGSVELLDDSRNMVTLFSPFGYTIEGNFGGNQLLAYIQCKMHSISQPHCFDATNLPTDPSPTTNEIVIANKDRLYLKE